MSFKELTFEDRALWLKWRHGGIGSSDASAIMEVSRFKSYSELAEEKSSPVTPEDQSNTYIKDRGNRIEKEVRLYLEGIFGPMQPLNVESTEFPFMRCSLDCINEDRTMIAEIKLLSVFNPEKPNINADGYMKWQRAKNKNYVPDEYYPQVMHQLMITGAKSCLFVGYKEVRGEPVTKDKLAIVEVFPDKQYTKELAAAEFNFWFDIQQRVCDTNKTETTYNGELE